MVVASVSTLFLIHPATPSTGAPGVTSESSQSTTAQSSSSPSSTTRSSSSSSTTLQYSFHSILFHGVSSFLFDSSANLIFSVNSNNTISELNATNNRIINSTYFVAPKNSSIVDAFVASPATLDIGVSSNSIGGSYTYIVQQGRVVEILSIGSPVFVTQNNLYFINGTQHNQTITVVSSTNYGITDVVNLNNCFLYCSVGASYYDPINGYAYIAIESFGEDGGHSWAITVFDTSNNTIQSNIFVDNPASFTYSPTNGVAYFSSAGDEEPLGCCSGDIIPGANITVVNGLTVNNLITINQNAGPVFANDTGFYPPESGANSTLGALAYNSTDGSIFVANGTTLSQGGQSSLRTIVRVSPSGSISVVANFQCNSVTTMFYDPVNGLLYVSATDNSC